MEERYNRNRIYLSEKEQKLVKKTRLLLGGAGIGSIIAECALRFGFENITIVDGDKVELSNLNRQNYQEKNLGDYKAKSLAEYLKQINSQANISYCNSFINEENAENIINGHDIAINALDFQSDIPFIFDNICKKSNIPVLHPYNLGWGGFVAVVAPQGISLTELTKEYKGFELKMAEYICGNEAFWNSSLSWLEKVIEQYKGEGNMLPPPQLAIGSWIVGGICTRVMYNLVTGKEVKIFPKYYLSTIL